MRIAILGGTFNPVHNGHLNIALEVDSRFDYQRILFVPANIPAHKEMDSDVGAGHRLAMLHLAVDRYPSFVVEDCELRRGGTSYTIDTVAELSRSYPVTGKPGLIVGDDLAVDLQSWREVDRLVEMVDLIVARRQYGVKVEIRYPCRYLDNSLYPISSSRIREILRAGGSSAGARMLVEWLPPEV
ncbi:MAG: nicotinate (nicotinamide) nucleotide adenylyltransferase, partial [Spirochaetales bacterium]|nr:nicotinate (nicotinamide) nucleotide adenylyltransferase [Spirochaetales bacterium]